MELVTHWLKRGLTPPYVACDTRVSTNVEVPPMARGNGTDSATAEAPAKKELTPEEQEKRKQRRQLRSYIVVPMPANMKSIFEAEAQQAEKPAGVFIRDLLAGQRGIEIPVSVSTPRRKYATDEEREAAQKTRRETRSNTMKALFAQFNALKAQGLSVEQATAQAAANVADGTPVPETAVPAAA